MAVNKLGKVSLEKRAITATKGSKEETRSKNYKNLKKASEPGSVIYLGHIPHGFFEEQIKRYFSQFGAVKRVKLSRSKKTGNSKGYAFVEFKEEEASKAAAESMNNYLMFHRLLKCQVVPKEQLHRSTFKGSKRQFHASIAHDVAAKRHDAEMDSKQKRKASFKLRTKDKKLQERLVAMGLSFSALESNVGEIMDTGLDEGDDDILYSLIEDAANEIESDSDEAQPVKKRKGDRKANEVVTPIKTPLQTEKTTALNLASQTRKRKRNH